MSDVKTYRAKRRLKVGTGYREPGELFPEGHLIGRIASHVHVGRVAEVEVDEDEFRDAVEQFIPEDKRAHVLALAGCDENVTLRGPHRTPGPRTPEVPVTETPEDTEPEHRVQGPVRKRTRQLPAKRVPAKKAGAKKRPEQAPTETVLKPGSDKAALVPQRKLTDQED